MIPDSTFLHDLIRKEPAAVTRLEDLIDTGATVEFSAITVFEVGVGLRGAAAEHREEFTRTVEALNVIPFGRREAWRALKIQNELYDRGEPIGAVDALIAGTVIRRPDPRILTRNVDEFERVEKLVSESFPKDEFIVETY